MGILVEYKTNKRLKQFIYDGVDQFKNVLYFDGICLI